MRIVKIVGFRGANKDRFPQVGLLDKAGLHIVSIEKTVRQQVIDASALDMDQDIEDLQLDGQDVSVWAIVDDRVLTSRAATEDEVTNAASTGATETATGWIISCEPYTRNVVMYANAEVENVLAECTDNAAIDECMANLTKRSTMGSKAAELMNNIKAIQNKKNASSNNSKDQHERNILQGNEGTVSKGELAEAEATVAGKGAAAPRPAPAKTGDAPKHDSNLQDS